MIVKNSLSELETITLNLEKFFGENALPASLLFEVNLAIEEIFTNIIFYAFNDSAEHMINISVVRNPLYLTITIEDSGIPFDPVTVPDPDLSKSLPDREIGGLGIHLIKKLMDHVEYHRVDDKNVLLLRKNLQPQYNEDFNPN